MYILLKVFYLQKNIFIVFKFKKNCFTQKKMKNKCTSSLIHSHSTSWLASWSCDLSPHTEGPCAGIDALALKIWTRSPSFSVFTGPHKLYTWSRWPLTAKKVTKHLPISISKIRINVKLHDSIYLLSSMLHFMLFNSLWQFFF